MIRGGSAHVDRPRFSIITPSFNQGRYIAETIRSVVAQGRTDVEHLVFDGGSSDGTVAVLREHDASLAYWQSSPDEGQPAAINAGLARARGEIIAFLNSDDSYLPGALDEIARLADEHPRAEWLLGGTRYFGDGIEPHVVPGAVHATATDALYFRPFVPQPGQFWRRSVFERLGVFDASLQYAFDYDFWVRCAAARVPAAATSRAVAGFRWHAESKTLASRSEQEADSAAVEARWFPVIEAMEGAYARRARARYHGHFALGFVRAANRTGSRREAWRMFVVAIWRFPAMLRTRAFVGTVQRLLGLRSD